MKKIAHFGAFDHDSYGDLLFPHLIEKQFPEYTFVHVAPTNIKTDWKDAKPIISVEEAVKIDDLSGIIIGGGDIIGSGEFYSNKWAENLKFPFGAITSIWVGASYLAAKLNINLAWNSPGVPNQFDHEFSKNLSLALESSDYIAVRDRHSKDRLELHTAKQISIVPDNAIMVKDLWPVVNKNNYIVISISKGDLMVRYNELMSLVKEIRKSEYGNLEVYFVPLMSWDFQNNDYRSKLNHLGINSSLVGARHKLEDIAKFIGESSGYIGNSLHGLITGLSYGIPSVLVIPACGNKNSKYDGFCQSVNLPPKSYIANNWASGLSLLLLNNKSNHTINNIDNISDHFKKIKRNFEKPARDKNTIWENIRRTAYEQSESLIMYGLSPHYLGFLSRQKISALDKRIVVIDATLQERTAWARSLESESKQRADLILELQKEVEQRGNHNVTLYDTIETMQLKLSHLESKIKSQEIEISEIIMKKDYEMLEVSKIKEDELSEIRRKISNISNENRLLNEIVESAMAWQKRSWFKRAFHRWRPPHKPKQKIGRLRKLERSIRKRRKKLFQKNKSKVFNIQLKAEVDLNAAAKSIKIFTSAQPKVSVIIPVYGQLEYTLECLKSIERNPPHADFEVIVIDDCSPDGSAKVLKDIKSIRLVQNAENSGFIRSCNAGVKIALGEYLYFLNNDTQVTPGWMDELLKTFDRFPGTGLVGSKLVYPDGSLQEAGGIIWKDGSAWNFGRNQDASLPVFNYAREVDYCSGASIMVPKSLFDELGGFDEHYLPAYCEDSDLALKIRDKGYRVIYQPLSEVVHFEGVSSGTDTSTGVKAYQVENMKKVFERWKHRLESHQPNAVDVDNAKDRVATRRVLFLDQCTPTPDMDSGSIDAFNTMMLLRDMGFQVTFIPVSNFHNDRKYTSAIQAHGIEALYHPHVSSVEQHLTEHGKRYDLIFACRHNTLEPHYHALRKYAPQAKILFHTVDLHFLREKREADLLQDPKLHEKAKRTEDIELNLIKECEITTVVSHVEKQVLNDMGMGEKVRVMPYSRHIRGTSVPFSQRNGIVFVGGFQHAPNVDAVNYFVHEIMPHLRPLLPGVIFHVVGSKVPDKIRQLEGSDVRLHGYVEDLEPLLDQMRVSVAPLRYGAGIKGKVGSAMCAGLPVVASPIATEGMNLTHGENVIIAKDPKEYAAFIAELYNHEDLWDRISKNGLVFAEQSWGGDAAVEILENILQRCELSCTHVLYSIKLWY